MPLPNTTSQAYCFGSDLLTIACAETSTGHFGDCSNTVELTAQSFRNRARSHYEVGAAPPLAEAGLLTAAFSLVHKNIRFSLICLETLILAHILVAEFLLVVPFDDVDESDHLLSIATALINRLSVPYGMGLLHLALTQLQRTKHMTTRPHKFSKRQLSIDIVVAHCREPLDWLISEISFSLSSTRLFIYEKCGMRSSIEHMRHLFSNISILSVIDPPDITPLEHSAYLSHILNHHGSDFASLTIFLHGNPANHLNFNFLRSLFRAANMGTYAVPFLALNGARLKKSFTPCLRGAHKRAFGVDLPQPLYPYCCGQFAVLRSTLLQQSRDFYDRMMQIADGRSSIKDICSHPAAVAFAFEYFWHIVFGEPADPGRRENDKRLPIAFRWEWYYEDIGEWHEEL